MSDPATYDIRTAIQRIVAGELLSEADAAEAMNAIMDGVVTGAEVADLDRSHSPELYIYVTSVGSGSYGSLVALAANRKRSLSDIHLPELAAYKKLSAGYMGHDQFSVVENVLGRRFPVYKPEDTNAKPTGGMRQIAYKLTPGEAGWVLRVKRVDNF